MASKYLKRFQVPNEFENILSDFAKEILRNQPKDIIQFGIEYFRGLENNIPLDYKDKGENRPENYKRPENQEPNIINAPNNLEISQEDKNRLQRSMDKIERINKEPEYIPEKEKEEKNVVKYESEERRIGQHEEQTVQVTKQVTVITKSKETVIRNGEVIKDEEKVEQKIYDDNNKKLESEPQVFKRTEENQQAEGRYKGVDSGYKTWFENNSEGGSVAVNNSSEVKQHGDNAYDDWFKRHSKPNMIIQYKPEVKKDENIVRYEGDYQTWFENHSKLTNKKI